MRVLWHSLSPDAVLIRLSSAHEGLSSVGADRRLKEVGTNELTFARPTPWWRMLLRQFVSPLIGILLLAAIVTLVQRHWVDSVAILLVLTVNAALGYFQE
jgi:Ca2+-transporting ATPase